MLLRSLLMALAVLTAASVQAQRYEPKEVKTAKDIKAGDGVVRLSLRTQRQFIETAYLYFIEVLPDGSDGPRTLQFERGAGVPVMGTNMIDVKAKYYRVPKGKYRLLAYTVACKGVPPPGATCNFGGARLPTERYATGSPTFDVIEGGITDAGDFVIEYIKDVDLDNFSLFKDRFSDEGYGVRWRPIKEALRPDFAALAAAPAPAVPSFFLSRIECDTRPKDKTVQFPFRCPAGAR
ncbi:MAG: hypothetical protein JSS55_11855 [Proteobacteria bacterium]|nr:hypothetical protein [Pseudomonadota bacterium]